ncbi:unnamed protein product, partial [Nesidiocoris tenuis]
MDSLYIRKTCIFAERRTFTGRFRRDGETITKYLNNLRSLAGTCEFGGSLNEHLRDQLVIGINNDTWQEQLIRDFPNNETTLKDVESAAIRMEQASDQQ